MAISMSIKHIISSIGKKNYVYIEEEYILYLHYLYLFFCYKFKNECLIFVRKMVVE